jgi:hypothetical protein
MRQWGVGSGGWRVNGLVLLLGIIAFASPLRAQEPAAVQVLGAEQNGERVLVHIAADSSIAAVPSEPFHLGGGRTRVFITLAGARLAAPFDSAFAVAGLLALRAEEREGAVRIVAEMAHLGDYGVERTEQGLTLWLAQAQPAAVPPAPVEMPAAPVVRVSRSERVAAGLRTVLASWDIGAPGRLAVLAGLLLFTFAAWRLHAHKPAIQVQAKSTGSAAPNGAARLWAAKTLAGEGLDADAIARQTGLARDIASLLVGRTDVEVPAATGTNFRPAPAKGASRKFGQKHTSA